MDDSCSGALAAWYRDNRLCKGSEEKPPISCIAFSCCLYECQDTHEEDQGKQVVVGVIPQTKSLQDNPKQS